MKKSHFTLPLTTILAYLLLTKSTKKMKTYAFIILADNKCFVRNI